MTVQQKRSLKVEKLARIYDEEIAPVWGTRFGKMLLRNLTVPERGQVLDVSCGTGWPTIEILRRMTDGSRLIAIDASSAMLDVARRKVADLGPLGKKGVFFRTESAVPKLSFTDDVYDLVVCNLGLDEMPSLDYALRDFARVAKRGGEVRCTLPLAGTFQEFHDLYREVLIKHDKHEALERLEKHIARHPNIDHLERAMRSANLDGHVEIEEFTLLFKSSREFFFAPVIEYGPLARVEGHRRQRPGDAGRVLVHQRGDRRLLRWPAVPGHGQSRLHHRQEARGADRSARRGRDGSRTSRCRDRGAAVRAACR